MRFRFRRAAVGFGLMVLGGIVSLPTVDVGRNFDEFALDRLRNGQGVPIERHPDGTLKTRLIRIEIGTDVFEMRTEYPAPTGVPSRRIFKTPTRDFVEVWDTRQGWIPGEVLRDESTLAARWGLPQTEWPYWIASALLIAGGMAFVAASVPHRRTSARRPPA